MIKKITYIIYVCNVMALLNCSQPLTKLAQSNKHSLNNNIGDIYKAFPKKNIKNLSQSQFSKYDILVQGYLRSVYSYGSVISRFKKSGIPTNVNNEYTINDKIFLEQYSLDKFIWIVSQFLTKLTVLMIPGLLEDGDVYNKMIKELEHYEIRCITISNLLLNYNTFSSLKLKIKDQASNISNSFLKKTILNPFACIGCSQGGFTATYLDEKIIKNKLFMGIHFINSSLNGDFLLDTLYDNKKVNEKNLSWKQNTLATALSYSSRGYSFFCSEDRSILESSIGILIINKLYKKNIPKNTKFLGARDLAISNKEVQNDLNQNFKKINDNKKNIFFYVTPYDYTGNVEDLSAKNNLSNIKTLDINFCFRKIYDDKNNMLTHKNCLEHDLVIRDLINNLLFFYDK